MARAIEKRVSAVRHVVYEYVNLVSAGDLVLTQLPPRVNSHVQHVFLVSCRTMAQFFTGPWQKDDIGSADFLNRKCRFHLPTWNQWKTHMNKHLMHLIWNDRRQAYPDRARCVNLGREARVTDGIGRFDDESL